MLLAGASRSEAGCREGYRMSEYVIGVDVGTGSVRAGIFTLDGRSDNPIVSVRIF